jgi:hypothetical protein
MAKKKATPVSSRSAVTEKDLLENFEQYGKTVRELAERYGVPEYNEGLRPEAQQPTYVFEPLFFYRVHASV